MAETFSNRLARESSPYLLQHAHNPVDWYAWDQEAFSQARRRDCPIFLSVGYSTCYWCHVMERESFENQETARVMNRHFVNIKVDREQRPDVDQLYMTAVQLMTHSGGWPMSVFLTPDLKPFYGGAYFPPQDGYGRPGFVTLLEAISEAWRERRQEVEALADRLVETIRLHGTPPPPPQTLSVDKAFLDSLLARSVAAYDKIHGGFGSAPKFPQETLLDLLLAYGVWRPSDTATQVLKAMLQQSLDAMARGGIRDHLGGAFHRYSTDARWLVPHFEIMLYDNAMLAPIYAEAGQQTGNTFFTEVARGVCDFVLRKMMSPGGGFYTALDAEVDAREGWPYVWTPQEVSAILPPDDAALFCRVYGIAGGPNFAETHLGDGTPDRNVLYLPRPLADAAAAERLPPEELTSRLSEMRARLLAAREQRKQPGLDTKILTGWNSLMIRGLVRCAAALEEPRYLRAAEKAGEYLLASHREADRTVLRAGREDHGRVPGTLEDYALLAMAMLSLHEASRLASWREAAMDILDEMHHRFAGDLAYYSTAAGQGDVIVRQQVGVDSPLPSGNGAAALAWLMAGRPERACPILAAFAHSLERQGEAMATLAAAAMRWVQAQGALVVEGESPATDVADQAHEVVEAELRTVTDRCLLLRLQIRPGWHIAGHQARGLAAATMVAPVGALADIVSEIHFPPGDTYTGEVAITIALTASPPPSATLVLTCQPCSDNACLSVLRKTVASI